MNIKLFDNATGDKIYLWENGKTPLFNPDYPDDEPSLIPYLLPGEQVRGCVIVCPGGGYTNKALDEGEPTALAMNELGYHAFVLDYRVAPYAYPVELYDVLRAIRVVRYNAQKWGIKPDKIAVCGFSAGGHLCSMAATIFDRGHVTEGDPIDQVSARPDAAILSYAVISLLPREGHRGSCKSLLGENDTPEMQKALSSHLNVTENTAPCFIWHTAQDNAVPLPNALLMANALWEKNVTVALHVYPYGQHGISLGNDRYMEPVFRHMRENYEARYEEIAAKFAAEGKPMPPRPSFGPRPINFQGQEWTNELGRFLKELDF